MENRQPAASQSSVATTSSTRELGEKMKKIEVKPTATAMAPPPPPPSSSTTTQASLGLLAKNTAALPAEIARVKQLKETALSPSPSSSSSSGAVAGTSTSSGSATGNPRNKTALAPGHSLMDWIRLGSSGVDLTGVGGKLLTVSPAELAKHNKQGDAWIAIRGVVYNVSRYLNFHPGGVPELMKGVGKDATKLFDEVHAWVNYQSILQKCVVGKLERSASLDLRVDSDKEKLKKSAKAESAAAAAASAPLAEAGSSAKAKSSSDVVVEDDTDDDQSEPRAPPPDERLKMEWKQTSYTVTFAYACPQDEPVGECRVVKLADSEFALSVCLEGIGEVVTHAVQLTEDVLWPPTWHKWGECPYRIQVAFKKKEHRVWQTYGTFVQSAEKLDASMRTYNEYEVLENTPLCKVVHLLVLRAQNHIQITPPGRHVEAKLNVMGTEVSRPYTPVPCCLHPADLPATAEQGKDQYCLMVKRYEGGAMTPALTSMQPGERLLLSCSLGDFRAEAYDDYVKLHLLAAGTGLTVMLSIIRRIVSKRHWPSMNLINFNRNQDSIFYEAQLTRVSKDRPLTLTQVLSAAEGSEWTGRTGTVSADLLKDLMGEHKKNACVLICGPPAFMSAARESLISLGWTESQMHEFDG